MKSTTTTTKNQTILAYVLLAGLVILSVFNVSAQKQASNWYFGNKAGLNLEDIVYPMGDGALIANAGSASICNADGDLRFYTNGNTVWNAKHLIMANGTGLLGNANASQGVIIVPKPGSTSLYYIFTTPYNGLDGNNQPDSLRYTLVDMSANAGLGEVVASEKNVALYGVVEEKLTAVVTADGTNCWLIAHGFKSNEYVSYKVSATGLSAPVVSAVGNPDILGGRGCMKAAPNGTKIARSLTLQNKAELCNFDAATGIVSNAITFTNLSGAYGIEFSSYSNRLYITTVGVDQNYIHQFNVKLTTSMDIIASKYTITPPVGTYPTALQLAYDGLLYIANSQGSSLGVITNADTLDINLIYSAEAQNILGTAYSGLPAFVQTYFRRIPPPPATTGINNDAAASIEIYPNPSTGTFRLNVGKNKSEDIKVNVYSMTGSLVYTNAGFEAGQHLLTVDLTKQPAGVYFFDVTTPAGKTVKRLVIN